MVLLQYQAHLTWRFLRLSAHIRLSEKLMWWMVVVCGQTKHRHSSCFEFDLGNLILSCAAPMGTENPRLAGEDVEVRGEQRAGHLAGLLREVQPPAVASSLERCRLRVSRDVSWRGGSVRPSVWPPSYWHRVHHLHCRASQVLSYPA